jgi:8-oxo-dGTP pyrophosphatase MutT (NUDIX family)/phosphohistidine phosphatase SixA
VPKTTPSSNGLLSPSDVSSTTKRIPAAGAVLWRSVNGSSAPEVAIIHRPRYDDWSLPKGKVDGGETEPVTAVREVHEETGYLSHLGRRLAFVKYPVEQGIKQVRYWTARALDGDFMPGAEVDDLVWLPVEDAMAKLIYPHDRKVLRRFDQLPADTHTVLVVRHGRAGSKDRYKGDDKMRPLDKYGRAQAESLVGPLLAFGAASLYAADRERCRQTLEPLAEELGATIKMEPGLTEEAYWESRKKARHRMLEIAASDGTPVICTQGRVIPDLIAWWCERDGVRPDKSRNRKGSVWVLSFADGKLIAADHLDSVLPRRN